MALRDAEVVPSAIKYHDTNDTVRAVISFKLVALFLFTSTKTGLHLSFSTARGHLLL
jgi:hypothetical protein